MNDTPYTKLSHFNELLKNNNEPNKTIHYSDKQFDEDLKKWISESKPITADPNDKLCKLIQRFLYDKMA